MKTAVAMFMCKPREQVVHRKSPAWENLDCSQDIFHRLRIRRGRRADEINGRQRLANIKPSGGTGDQCRP